VEVCCVVRDTTDLVEAGLNADAAVNSVVAIRYFIIVILLFCYIFMVLDIDAIGGELQCTAIFNDCLSIDDVDAVSL